MSDSEKVIKGFTVCSEHGLLNGEDCHGHYAYTDNLEDIIKANDYSKQCPYNGCKTGCIKTLAKDALALLKEQEAVKPTWNRGRPFCGACGLRIRGGKFCSECGKPILWEGQQWNGSAWV